MFTGKLEGMNMENQRSMGFSRFDPFRHAAGATAYWRKELEFSPFFFFQLQISSSVRCVSGNGEWEKGLLKAEPIYELFALKNHGYVLSPSLNRSLSQVTLLHVSYGLSCSETDDALLPDKGPIWLTVRQQNQWFLVEIQILENAL